ncbi:ThiF family adenylyltransferase [Mycolicibacterium fortuitum]|uniref:ThiF family adenylyltransferase n=1 Tax=Mycolicibacterium fortuitum TaxID=1766 RepID=UPI003AAE6165
MADTPNSEHLSALSAQRDAFRSALARLGFSDDGTSLQGRVAWVDEQQASHDARIEVTLDDRFPFAPPNVTILEVESGFVPTFHIERDGKLCLWPSDIPVHDAPWRDPNILLDKVSGWFTETAAGWPGDEDADLERYLESSRGGIILYDNSALEHDGYFKTQKNKVGVVTVGERLQWRPNAARMGRKGVRRRERNLLWVADVGPIDRPIRTFQDLQDVTGQSLETVRNLVKAGSLEYVLVRYQRGPRQAALLLDFPNTDGDVPVLAARESADQSVETRTLRAGAVASTYADKKVAIVGSGAIGSHVADLLFRSGVTQLTLIDPEVYRPGNVIRHTAHHTYAGASKTIAVKTRLAATGLDVSEVTTENSQISRPEQTLELVKSHDLVIDATADARATALLRWAGESTGRTVISVCVQRDGGIARVDRFPLRENESHLLPVPHRATEGSFGCEQGCGSPVSVTPPMSVVKAAAVACQVALDELGGAPVLPATMLEVIEVQEDEPYNVSGLITS